MKNPSRLMKFSGVGMSLVMFAALGTTARAQDANVEGMIVGRSGPMMYVRTDATPRQIVVLSDDTKATEKGGFLGWSHKNHGIADLVPGLEVKVDGTFDADHQLVAKKIEFSHGDYKTAKQIDAGLNPVNEKMAKQQDQLASNRRDIESGQQDIAGLHTQTDANGQAIGQANVAIGATNGRIGELDQYDEKGSLTINFKNGSAVVAQKDQDALEDFVKNAASMQGFMLQVQGYASKVGNPKLNQKLSSERADNVLTIIQQSGAVPLTRILAPAAMGTTNQVADNHTRSGQAENRRVIVTILVNKGIMNGPEQTASATPAPEPGQE